MFEVELKAHVDDRDFVVNALNSFATYDVAVQKDDFYWGTVSGGTKIQARIRRETESGSGENPKSKLYFTYKQKELRQTSAGTQIEVNDEKDSLPVEEFFKDLGLKILLEKHKSVVGWHFDDAHIELCSVPPLGDFLEIEILSESDDEENVRSCKEKILSLFRRCGIGEEKIENRYYSDLLRQVELLGNAKV